MMQPKPRLLEGPIYKGGVQYQHQLLYSIRDELYCGDFLPGSNLKMRLKLDNFLTTTMRSLVSVDGDNKPSMWIFGYGSLIWNPHFQFDTESRARLPGYSRRFYQGNTTFRGTPEKSGRVVTILPEHQSETFGLAFKVRGWTQLVAALEHLHKREVQNGYVFQAVTLELIENGEYVQALTCVALEDNALFMPAPFGKTKLDSTRSMALEIATASGTAGPNHEYLTKLADCMRRLFPLIWDDHLYMIEAYLKQYLKLSDFESETEVELGRGNMTVVRAS